MIKGYWERRLDKNCESIYLLDDNRKKCITISFTEHDFEEGYLTKSTDIHNADTEILKALAQALISGGYLEESSVTAELKATKAHLEDMRKLTLKKAYF